MKPRIFISAVSEEFATLRDQHVDPLLRKLGYEPIAMNVFNTGNGDLRQYLRDQVDSCEGLIQLVGAAYGREPPTIDDDYGRVSYTQFELLYARLKGKKVWVFPAQGEAVARDKAIADLDLPPAGERVADPSAYQAERRNLQASYTEQLRRDGQLRHSFDSTLKLENLLHGIKDELHELYRQWVELQEQLRQVKADTGAIRKRSTALLWSMPFVFAGLAVLGLLAAPQSSCRLPGVAALCQLLELNKPTHDIADIKAMLEALVAERAAGQTSTEAPDSPQSPIALRSALEDIIQTVEGQAALQRFQNGEEVQALKDLDRLEASHARSIANLALTAVERGKLSVSEVIARYERVVALDASEWDWFTLSELYEQAGKSEDMLYAAEKMLSLAHASREQSAALERIGDAKTLRGDAPEALAAYQQSLNIRETLAKADPFSAIAQRDVSVSLNRVGDIKAAQGDAPGALAAFQQSLSIAETLAKADPTSALAQRDLSVSLNKVGDIKAAQGDAQGALEAYQRMLDITEALAKTDPYSALAQRDVSVSLNKVGDIKAAQGDAQGALAAFQQSLTIAETLAEADPSSAQAQRDVYISLQNVGRIQAAQGNTNRALDAFQRMLAITEALAKADPSSAIAQRDVSISLSKVGDIKALQGDAQGALAAFRKSLTLREALAKADPSSAVAQRDISVALNRIGEIKAAQGDALGALAAFQQSLNVAESLAKAGPSNAEAQRDVSVSLERIGNIKAAQGDAPGALAAYQQSLTIAETLAKTDPSSAVAQRDLMVSLGRIGDIKAAQGDAPGALAAYQQTLTIAEALAKADPSSAVAQRDLMVGHAKLWQFASERDVKIKHAREIGRIFSQLEARGAHISPADRQGWQGITQWLQDIAG